VAVAVRRVSSKTKINLDDLGHIGDRFLKQEIRDFTSRVGLEENRQQYQQGNTATRVVIDRKTTINLSPTDAKRLASASNNVVFFGLEGNLRFYYTSNVVLAQALSYAWNLLRSLTKVGPLPRAIDTYYIWCSDPDNPGRSKKCTNLSDAQSWIAASSGPLVNVRILGPTAEYRRKLIYSPKGRKVQSKLVSPSKGFNKGKAIDRNRFLKPIRSKLGKTTYTDKPAFRFASSRRKGLTRVSGVVAKAIQEIVVQNVKRQFRDIRTGYRFVTSKELPLPLLDLQRSGNSWRPDEQNVHIPELWLGVKVKHGN
jgi:hypothetical protein